MRAFLVWLLLILAVFAAVAVWTQWTRSRPKPKTKPKTTPKKTTPKKTPPASRTAPSLTAGWEMGMKAFGIWALLALLAFAGFAGGVHAHLSAHPTRILVAIDSSFPMAAAWDRVPAALERLEETRYAAFALRSERGAIHDWSDDLNLGQARAYGARDLSGLTGLTVDADRRVLITNAASNELEELSGWEILRP